jgi:hypothetical protein
MAQEETNKRDDEQPENEPEGGNNPTDPPAGDEIDDGCGGNP